MVEGHRRRDRPGMQGAAGMSWSPVRRSNALIATSWCMAATTCASSISMARSELIAQPAGGAERTFHAAGAAGKPVQDLEPPGPDENPVMCPSTPRLSTIVDDIVRKLELTLLAEHPGNSHDPHRAGGLRRRRHAGDARQTSDRWRETRGAAAKRCRHRFHDRQQPSDRRHAVSDRAARDHAADRVFQRQFDCRSATEPDRTAPDPRGRGSAQPRSA